MQGQEPPAGLIPVGTPDERLAGPPVPGGTGGSASNESPGAETGMASRSGSERETIEEPARLLRIATMVHELLDEVRGAPLDENARRRLQEVYDRSLVALREVLSDDLRAELDELALPFGKDDRPSDAELRVAEAQLVGWLEGLFRGMQAAISAQRMQQAQLEEQMRRSGVAPAGAPVRPGPLPADRGPGGYL